MRILQVAHQFLPHGMGGTEVYTYELSRELLRRGHTVLVFYRETDGVKKGVCERAEGQYQGVPFWKVRYYRPNKYSPPKPLRHFRKLIATFRDRKMEEEFGAALERFQPDIVHFQHLVGLSASMASRTRQRGIPRLMTLHDFWLACWRGNLLKPNFKVCSGPLGGLKCSLCHKPSARSLRRLPLYLMLFPYRVSFLRGLLKEIDLFVAPSRFMRDYFLSYGLDPRKILFLDNGLHLPGLQPLEKSPSPRLRFGFVGRISPLKGVHVLVEAFNGIEEGRAELKIYGNTAADEAYFSRLARLVTHPGIRFMGGFDNREAASIYAQVDVVVVPSIWYENSPLVIHEAFLTGTPVIASNLGGMAELVQDGRNGLLFQVGDAADLRRAMERVIEQPQLLEVFRRNAGSVMGIEENAVEMERIYQGLAEKKGGGERGRD